jgi:polar amino acid transport system substrate-binding protein
MARLFFFMFCLMAAKVAAATGIVACGGDNGWPPSSYFGPPQHNNARPVLGYSPDVLHAVLSSSAFRPEFVLLPFRRCLSLAEQGRQVQVVMGATFSAERARLFLFSRRYLHLRPALFLWPGAAPSLPLCGLIGFNYAPFGLKPGDVDEGSSSYLLVMKKLQAGRCRGFAEYAEVGRSLQWLGLLGEDGVRLQARLLPGLVPVPLHFMVSRAYPEAEALLRQVDRQLELMERSGQLDALLARHQAAEQ